MASMAASLSRALPKPKYTGEDEELPQQQRGPRILGAGALDDSQIVLKVTKMVTLRSAMVLTYL